VVCVRIVIIRAAVRIGTSDYSHLPYNDGRAPVMGKLQGRLYLGVLMARGIQKRAWYVQYKRLYVLVFLF
jgi:hypothetical protein